MLKKYGMRGNHMIDNSKSHLLTVIRALEDDGGASHVIPPNFKFYRFAVVQISRTIYEHVPIWRFGANTGTCAYTMI